MTINKNIGKTNNKITKQKRDEITINKKNQ